MSIFAKKSQPVLTSCQVLAYFTYIRPILEYASVVWSPFIKTNIDKIEMVQHKAAIFVLNDYHRYSSVSHMLQQ